MRRDRRWVRWPLAVLLGTALALAPFLGAAAYAMEDDAAGGSPSVTVETVDDVTMPVVEAEPASRAGTDAPPDPGAGFVPDGIAASAEELALELDVGGEVMLSADIEATSQLVTTTVVTLDLNGHVLTASIVVRDGMLVVRDSSESQAGALVGPDGAFPIVAEGACAIEGGLFSVQPPEDYLADGYVAVEKDGGWSVVSSEASDPDPATQVDPDDPGIDPDPRGGDDPEPGTVPEPGTDPEPGCDPDPAEEPEHVHDLTLVEEVSATCTTDGTRAHWACSGCDALFADAEGTQEVAPEDLTIPAAHQLEAVAEKAATCTEAGAGAHWRCAACGALYADEAATVPTGAASLAIPALGHSPVFHEAVAATAEAEGTRAHWSCATCGRLFSDEALTKEVSAADVTIPRLPVYTVTFDDCVKSTKNAEVEVVGGKAVARPADPALKGWKFEGWYLYDDGWARCPYDFSTPVTCDLTLYARWSEVPEPLPETGDELDLSAPAVLAVVGGAAVAVTLVMRRSTER